MRKRILTSVTLAGVLWLTGCGGDKANSVNQPGTTPGAGGKPTPPPAPEPIPPPPRK